MCEAKEYRAYLALRGSFVLLLFLSRWLALESIFHLCNIVSPDVLSCSKNSRTGSVLVLVGNSVLTLTSSFRCKCISCDK